MNIWKENNGTGKDYFEIFKKVAPLEQGKTFKGPQWYWWHRRIHPNIHRGKMPLTKFSSEKGTNCLFFSINYACHLFPPAPLWWIYSEKLDPHIHWNHPSLTHLCHLGSAAKPPRPFSVSEALSAPANSHCWETMFIPFTQILLHLLELERSEITPKSSWLKARKATDAENMGRAAFQLQRL